MSDRGKIRLLEQAKMLMKMSRAKRFDDAQKSLDWAELAVLVAEHLDNGTQGNALAHLACAQRLVSDHTGAEASINRAEELYGQEGGQPLLEAELLETKANLRLSQERFEEAVGLFAVVQELHEKHGDQHSAGAAMADKGAAYFHLEKYDVAISLLRDALKLIDPERDGRRYLNTRHSLANCLYENGETEVAATESMEVFYEAERQGDRLTVTRSLWLQGRMALSLKQLTIGAHCLRGAVQQFIAQGMGLDAAEVGIELCIAYGKKGWSPTLHELGLQMQPILSMPSLPSQVATTLVLLFNIIDGESTNGVFLMTKLQDYLRQVREDPQIGIEPLQEHF